MSLLDASPGRERLGRVVELLRGVEDAHVRWTARPRSRRVQRRHAPLRAIESWATIDVEAEG